MKYLVSAKQLGKLEIADWKTRKEMIEDIISLQYINNTSDKDDLSDCIKINEKSNSLN